MNATTEPATLAPAPISAPSAPLPEVTTDLPPPPLPARLDEASRRGRLAGYTPLPSGDFSVTAYGDKYDYDLIASPLPAPPGSRLAFRLSLPLKLPLILAATIAFTIWPGVWLTDSMLTTYFPSYASLPVKTWMWYLPLTILPLPWMCLSLARRSRAAAESSAHEMIAKIAAELGGAVHPAPAPAPGPAA